MSRYSLTPFLRMLIAAGLIFFAAPQVSQAAPIQTGSYSEDFTSYSHLDYTDQAVWDVFSPSLRLRRSNGVYGNYGYDYAAMAWDNHSHIYAAWVDTRQVYYGIYLQKLDADGKRLWQNDVFVSGGDAPVMATGDDGSVMVAWRGGGAMMYNPDGSPAWAGPKFLTPSGAESVQIASAGSGSYWLVWMMITGAYSADTGWIVEFSAKKVDSAGNTLLGPIALTSAAHSFSSFAGKLAVDSSGGAWFTWLDTRSPGVQLGYLQGVSAGGTLIYPQEHYLGPTHDDPVLTSTANGIIVARQDQGVHFDSVDLSGGVTSALIPEVNWCPVVNLERDPDGYLWLELNCISSINVMKFSPVGQPQLAQAVELRRNVTGEAVGFTMDASGPRVALAWSDNRADDKQVRLMLLSRQGAPAWPVERVVNDDLGPAVQTSPVLAVTAEGTQFVAWKDNRRGQNNIYLQSLTAAGDRRWAADILVNNPKTETVVEQPLIGVDLTGGIYVAWRESSLLNIKTGYLQRYDANGNQTWLEPLTFSLDYGDIGMAADPAGGAAMAWFSAVGTLMLQRFDENGAPRWAAPVDAGIPADVYIKRLDLAVGPDSSIAIALPGLNDHRVFVQRFSAGGESSWPQPVAGSTTIMDNTSYGQQLVIDSTNNVILVWYAGNSIQAFAQKISPLGDRLWNGGDGLLIGQSINVSPSVMLAIGAGDQPVFATTPEDYFTLHAYQPDGSLSWETSYMNGAGAFTMATPALAADADGKIYVAWQDLRNGNWDIYTNQLSPAGEFASAQPLQLVTPDAFMNLSGLAVSTTVDTLAGPLLEANLTADYDLDGGQIVFSLSNDGGSTWEPVAPGVNHRFASHGSDLRWKAELASDPLWPRGPVVRSLNIEYSALPLGADDYEIDDTCAEAQPIETAGVAQVHSIHLPDDEDWVRFDALSGQVYAIQASEVGENAELSLQLYDACGGTLLAASDNPASRNARLDWAAPQDMPVYLRAANVAPGAGLPESGGYLLSVRGFDPSPLVILAVGSAAGAEQQTALNAAGDRAYNTFLAAGTDKSRIQYFSPSPVRDVDGNGLPDDIAAPLSHDLLRDAIQDWARLSGAGLGVPVYLVLLGPGQPDSLFPLNAGETVGVEELNLWLGNLEATSGADQLTVILEAPYSGSFIDPAAGSLSGANRVVLTSTSDMLDSYLTIDGAVFSDALFAALAQEFNLRAAFDQAAQAVAYAVGVDQQPWIDDNGDAIPDLPAASEGGAALTDRAPLIAGQLSAGLVSQKRGFDTARSDAPEIQSMTYATAGNVYNFSVRARDDVAIQTLTASMYPCKPAASGGPQPVIKPTRVTFAPKAGSPGWYTASASRAGVCRLNLLALDAEGNRSAPYTVDLVRFVFLPMVRR